MVKYCIKHVGLVKNVVFLIDNCLGAMTIWLVSGIRLLSGIQQSLSPGYYPVSGKMVSGTSLQTIAYNQGSQYGRYSLIFAVYGREDLLPGSPKRETKCLADKG